MRDHRRHHPDEDEHRMRRDLSMRSDRSPITGERSWRDQADGGYDPPARVPRRYDDRDDDYGREIGEVSPRYAWPEGPPRWPMGDGGYDDRTWAGPIRGDGDGRVRSWWREAAAQPQSFAGRGPRNYRRSDDRIREDVCDRFTDDERLDASDITVEVKDGEVILTGTVTERDQKRRAEDLAERVSGVRDVSNHIRLNRGATASPTAAGAPDPNSKAGLIRR